MKGISLSILLAIALSSMCILFVIGHVGCNGAARSDTKTGESTSEAVLEQDFKIKYGQELTVKGEDMKVKFDSLLEDSRCPADVTCVWEGDAKILISVRQTNAEGRKMELHTNRKFNQAAKYQQYVIRLVGLDPYPRIDAERKQSDYVATLLIKKE